MLPIIVFSIFFGLALTMIGRGAARTADSRRARGRSTSAMIVLVNIIMSLAPYGVFAIIAAVTAQLGFDFLLSLLRYALVTIGSHGRLPDSDLLRRRGCQHSSPARVRLRFFKRNADR